MFGDFNVVPYPKLDSSSLAHCRCSFLKDLLHKEDIYCMMFGGVSMPMRRTSPFTLLDTIPTPKKRKKVQR